MGDREDLPERRELVIELVEGVRATTLNDFIALVEPERWRSLMTATPGITFRSAFPSTELGLLDAMRERVRAVDPTYDGPSLASFVVLRFPADPVAEARDEALRTAIHHLAAVNMAYFASTKALRRFRRGAQGAVDGYDSLRLRQPYLDAAPTAEDPDGGIDARFAWSVAGGTGDGVTVCDVERGWVLQHEALAAQHIALCGHNQTSFGHGTAVLGILCGGGIPGCDPQRLPARPQNHAKLIGIVPCARAVAMSVYQQSGAWNVGDAIAKIGGANPQGLTAGDIVIIEDNMTKLGVAGPVESDPHVFHAIRQLVLDRGVVVVASAGNGDWSLDDALFAWPPCKTHPERHPFDVDHPGFVDSGSILVGAATLNRLRDGDTNFGRRVNCFARGTSIATCGDGESSTSTTVYIDNFGDTSGATAIVGGAAAALQGMLQAAGRPRLGSSQMRSMLSDPRFATPAADIAPWIGVMPDLRRLAIGLGLAGVAA